MRTDFSRLIEKMSAYTFLFLWGLLIFGLGYLTTKEPTLIDGIKKTYEERSTRIFMLFASSMLILIVGYRTSAVDSTVYISYFYGMPNEVSEIGEYMKGVTKSPGFFRLACYFKCFISEDYHDYFLFFAILTGFAVLIPLRRYSVNFGFSFFLFIASAQFSWMLNGVKQFCAASLIFFAMNYLYEKKLLKWLFFVFIAYFFHSTCLIVLPFYFVVRGKPWNYKVLLFIAAILLSVTFVGQFTNFLSSALEDTTYGDEANKIANSVSGNTGSNILRFFIALVPAALALAKKKKVDEQAPDYINCCINFSIVTAGFYLISSFTSGMLLGRIAIYFSMYSAILIPWLLEKCYSKQERFIIIPAAIVLYYIFYIAELSNWTYWSDKYTWFNTY